MTAVALDALTAIPLLADGEHRWWVWLLDQALVLPLVVRRRWPFLVFGVMAAVAFVQWLTGVRLVADAALLIALYTVIAHETRQRALLAVVTIEVGVVLAAIRFAPGGDQTISLLVFLSGLVAAALFIGTTLRTRREFLLSVVDRAQRLERERDQQARLAATAERTRIAREMHDIVAHSLTVMVALADGAALASPAGAEATEAMRHASATGRQALREMRRLLGVLRDDETAVELSPQPDLDLLDDLVAQVRAAGLAVRLTVAGQSSPLPPTAATTVYRIVQESLTNTLKHAHNPTETRVILAWSPESLSIEIADNGDTTNAASDSGAGHGLPGMRERIAIFGGMVTAGPQPKGGWRVLATLPVPGHQP